MKVKGIGNYTDIDDFVKAKIDIFKKNEKSFKSLFEMMFSEKNNIMYEFSTGYRIVKKTYGEVHEEIIRLAGGLEDHLSAFDKDAVIALYMDNSLEWIELFWSVILCGHNILLLNTRVGDDLLEKAITDSGAAAVITSGKTFSVPSVCASDIKASDTLSSFDKFADEVLVMSSGTTRNIKICAYTAEEFFRQICGSYEIIKECPAMKKHFKGELKLLTLLPFYHVFGLIAVYIWFGFFSRTFVELSSMAPRTLINTIKRHKVTHVFAVPLFWDTVYENTVNAVKERGEKTYSKFVKALAIEKKLHDIPLIGRAFSKLAFKEVRENLFGDSICFMISGGSAISEKVLSFFNGIGYRFANGYGMTEIGITSVELSNRKKYLYSGCIGSPIADCEYRINGDGTLSVRGGVTAKYIIENGIKQNNDDWYDTEDLARCENGHYLILSRKDDIIISSNGENINPNLIEPHFAVGGVKNVCLIKSQKGGRITPVLLVSVDKYIGSDAFSALTDRIRKIAAEIKFPNDGKFCFTSAPLINDTEFKLNRLRLAEDFDNGRLKELSSVRNTDDLSEEDGVSETVRLLFSTALNKPDAKIGADDDFFLDLDGTSLEYFALCAGIKEEFGVSVPMGSEESCRTVRRVLQFIKEEKNRVD